MRQYQHPTLAQITLIKVFHALRDPVRLLLVQRLARHQGEQATGAIETTVAKSTLSHHLRILREAGIVQMRVEGTHSFILLRLGELEERFPSLLSSIVHVV